MQVGIFKEMNFFQWGYENPEFKGKVDVISPHTLEKKKVFYH